MNMARLSATIMLLVVAICYGVQPEQVHLALGKADDTASVAWATLAPSSANNLYWSSVTFDGESSASADTRPFTQDANRTWYTHVAMLTGLVPNTQYSYRVEADGVFSQNFTFIHRRQGAPYKHIIFGDLGAQCAFSVCKACTSTSPVCDSSTCAANTSAGMVGEVATADMLLHLGDFAYNLDTQNGAIGDQFMRNIEQIATSTYYMVSHGNHEDGSGALAHYIERFRSMPTNAIPATFTSANGETTNSMYFSWDVGLVHYVSLSTELWFGVTDNRSTTASFLEWVQKDLTAANANRENVPWIIMQGHRSVYCSCDGDCDSDAVTVRKDLEPLMMQYGVDFFINGHEHNYERSFPLYKGKSDRSNIDPKAPIYIVSGAAGNTEMHEPFTRPQPSWSAFRANTFGYSRMTVYNSTHLHWQQIATDPTQFPGNGSTYGSVIDDAWIIQHRHGPFDMTKVPTGQAFAESEKHLQQQIDHWWPLLELDNPQGLPTERVIADWRAEHGEKAWVEKLNGLQRWAQKGLGGHVTGGASLVQWEDVREDGSSDGAVFTWKDSRTA